jgi:hypothetical protein
MDTKGPTRLIAERIIENLEEMELPKVAHAAREEMIGEVHGTIEGMLSEFGYVQIVRPNGVVLFALQEQPKKETGEG